MQKTVNSVSNIYTQENGSKLSTDIFDNFYSVNLLLNSKIVYFLKFSDQPQEIIEIRAKFTICSKIYL